jgi:hypothetical protein
MDATPCLLLIKTQSAAASASPLSIILQAMLAALILTVIFLIYRCFFRNDTTFENNKAPIHFACIDDYYRMLFAFHTRRDSTLRP